MRRTAVVLLVWTAVTVLVAVTAVSALLGRADFGDGGGASMSGAAVLGLFGLDVVAIAAAIWVTRRVR